MITTMMSYIPWKPARVLIWIILSFFFLKQMIFPFIISNSLQLWTSIKHSKFMYIILNIIIISILITSTSFTPLFINLFLKLHKICCTSNHDDDDDHQTSHEGSSPDDDDHDVWWFFSLSQMDKEPAGLVSTTEVQETAPFEVQQVDKHCIDTDNNEHNLDVNKHTRKVVSPAQEEDTWWFFSLPEMEHKSSDEEEKSRYQVPEEEDENNPVFSHGYGVEKIANNNPILSHEYEVGEEKRLEEEGEGDKEDSLDATWKAIMESKGKESGPQLKKSDTWSAGDGGVEERRKGVVGGLSKYRVTVQLKKWQSFRDMIERREYYGGSDGGGDHGGGGGGDKRGWKSVDMALTFHDELKKRADAFIDRFTDSIRLQRLESTQRFMEMINRSH